MMKTFYNFLEKLNSNLKIIDSKTVLVTSNESYSYQSLNHKVGLTVRHFRKLGIGREEIIPLLIANSPEFIAAVLALWMLEAIPVPLNINLTANEIEEQFKFLNCSKVVTDKSLKKKLNNDDFQQIFLDDLDQDLVSSEVEFSFDENRTAVIMFTSGSSEKPKAVELSFYNLINSSKIGNTYLKHASDDRWLASLPFYHIGGFSIIFRALTFETVLIIPDNLKIDSMIKCIREDKPTLLSLVSSQLNYLLEHNVKPALKLRHILLGGGFIDSNLMREAINKGWKVSKVYGSTETSSFVTILSSEDFKLKPESIGKPIPPNEILILDKYGNELPNFSEGELAVKSLATMRRYFNDETSNKTKFVNDKYLTGDIGYRDSDGYLYLVNRRIDLIVTGGENVTTLEVEEIIMQFPQVKEVCAFGIENEKWGQKISAAIVTHSNVKFSLQELKDFLEGKIASFKIPKQIFFVDELPKTELGKVRRGSVKKLFT